MIFATTGTQLAFPRLMAALNTLAPDLGEQIIAQAGPDPATATAYPALTIRDYFSPAEYDRTVTDARLIVAHAGIGTILTARRYGKPLILMPRRHDMGEHRNDHQLATARQVEQLDGVYVAWEARDLAALLTGAPLHPASETDTSGSRAALIGFVEAWVTERPDRGDPKPDA